MCPATAKIITGHQALILDDSWDGNFRFSCEFLASGLFPAFHFYHLQEDKIGKGSMSLAEGHSLSAHSLLVPAPHCPVPRGPQPNPTPSSSLVLLWELSWGRAGGMGQGEGPRPGTWPLS